jgi:hypothetical protein
MSSQVMQVEYPSGNSDCPFMKVEYPREKRDRRTDMDRPIRCCSFTLECEEQPIIVFENRMLSRTCNAERQEATGGWRKLCNE